MELNLQDQFKNHSSWRGQSAWWSVTSYRQWDAQACTWHLVPGPSNPVDGILLDWDWEGEYGECSPGGGTHVVHLVNGITIRMFDIEGIVALDRTGQELARCTTAWACPISEWAERPPHASHASKDEVYLWASQWLERVGIKLERPDGQTDKECEDAQDKQWQDEADKWNAYVDEQNK